MIEFVSAQKSYNIDLKDTNWFVNNKNESFYKSDTISFIRIEKYDTYQDEINSKYIKIDYNEGNDTSLIELQKNGEANIVDLSVERWTNSRFNDKWTWNHEREKNEVSFYLKGELYLKFEIYSIGRDTIISEYGYSGDGTKSKLNLIKLELKRKK